LKPYCESIIIKTKGGGMIVYIEYVLINNFIVTFMLLIASSMCLKRKNSMIRNILACIFGAILAILYPLCNLDGIILLITKCLAGFLICSIAYKCEKLKNLFVYYFIFIFLTAMYGGINMMIYFAIYGDFSFTKTLPLPIILFSIFLITYFLKQIIFVFYKKKDISQYLYEIEINNNSDKLFVNAYLDSGNILCDPQNNNPIIVINYKIFNKLFYNFSPIKLATKNVSELKNAHYINVSTVTKNGEMLVFNVDNIILNLPGGKKEIKMPSLGLTNASFKHLGCDILLNPKLMG
jgi:stage II sporulation protein GA (sporulation sigma-E factor processing peptidase)